MKSYAKTATEQSAARSKKSECLSWAEHYSKAINNVIDTLETLIKRWESFRDRTVPLYFNEPDMSGPLEKIEHDFEDLKELRDVLRNFRKDCESHTSNVRADSALLARRFEKANPCARRTAEESNEC
jgi:hypothetical protein